MYYVVSEFDIWYLKFNEVLQRLFTLFLIAVHIHFVASAWLPSTLRSFFSSLTLWMWYTTAHWMSRAISLLYNLFSCFSQEQNWFYKVPKTKSQVCHLLVASTVVLLRRCSLLSKVLSSVWYQIYSWADMVRGKAKKRKAMGLIKHWYALQNISRCIDQISRFSLVNTTAFTPVLRCWEIFLLMMFLLWNSI